MDKERKDQLRKAVLLIRFRTIAPKVKSVKYSTHKVIAKALNLTENEVQHICRKVFFRKKLVSFDQMARKLLPKHIDFLTNYRTLELWSGLPMKERVRAFHGKFTHKRISVTSLRRLYLKNGIKRKKVRQEKFMPEHVRRNFRFRCATTLNEVLVAKV